MNPTEASSVPRGPLTFYVDARAGSDENDGLRESTSFRTVERVSAEVYQPGDTILFKRGATYHGNLVIHARGSAESPVYVGAYGQGHMPKIAAKGGTAITLKAVYLTLDGLEVTNPLGPYGIRVLAFQGGANRGIRICRCYVHDINLAEEIGWKGYIGSGGIIARADGPDPVWFENLMLCDNVIKNTSRMGITISNSWGWRYYHENASYIRNRFVDDEHGWYPNVGCQITGNTIDSTGGDSILVQCGKDTRIERNTVYHANASTKEHAKIAMVAIWTICTVNTVMQYNEVGYTKRPGADGEAFDTDHAEVGCTIQYNYSHNNEGGFVLLCNGMPGTAKNATVRYNLSVNDGRHEDGACIQFIGDVLETNIYNNTFWLSAASRIMDVWRNRAACTWIAGNIFAAPAGAVLAYTARPDPKPGGSVTDTDFCKSVTGFVFENNVFYQVPLPPVGGGVQALRNREEDPLFSVREFTETDYTNRERMVEAFTPKHPLIGAPSIPDNGGRDILGAEITADFYGCVGYFTQEYTHKEEADS